MPQQDNYNLANEKLLYLYSTMGVERIFSWRGQ